MSRFRKPKTQRAHHSSFLVPQLGRRYQGTKGNNGGVKANGLRRWDPSVTLWNRKLANVVKTVLVLRIEAADSATTASETQLTDDIFGSTGDPVNLKSQFNQCSYGLQFEPISSNIVVGSDGVYTVTDRKSTRLNSSHVD